MADIVHLNDPFRTTDTLCRRDRKSVAIDDGSGRICLTCWGAAARIRRVIAVMTADERGVPCTHCGSPPGRACLSMRDRAVTPHDARRSLAVMHANADSDRAELLTQQSQSEMDQVLQVTWR